MSKHAAAFILLNLGSEMLYVISQRLKAQNISAERSIHGDKIVLDEITSSLINQQLITDLLNNQEPLVHGEMKDLIETIAQSSIMRLDATSMDRLWDLITMVFKWQLTLAQETFTITIRHLYELETFATNPETQLNLHRVQNTIDNYAKILTETEKHQLLDYILYWLRDFDIRVSLLLRLGFQHGDATFKTRGFDARYAEMLDNLGENIYAAAAKYVNLGPKAPENAPREVDTMVEQLLGPTDTASTVKPENMQFFKLSLGDTFDVSDDFKPTDVYSRINVQSTSCYDVFDVGPTQDNDSIHEELIKMLDETL